MKKTAVLILAAVILASLAYAADMSDFPDLFVSSGKLNAIVAVGNKGSAIDVISQSNLIQFFSVYTNNAVKNSAKLSDEVASLDQNIISVGSPCTNDLTRKILGYPKPCDENIQKDRAYIYLYENGKYKYLLVFGYDDKLTRKAADVLVNYAPYKLQGTEIIIDSDSKIVSMKNSKNVYQEKQKPEDDSIITDEYDKTLNTSDLENDIDQIDSQEFNETRVIENVNPEIKIGAKTEKNGTKIENKIIPEENFPKESQKGIFSRLWIWLTSLFG